MMQDAYPRSQMHVEQRGSGPRVVFVHGGEEKGGTVAFAAQFPLAHAFTLILPDLPGYGQSPAQGGMDVERDARLIADLLDGGAHLVGHSYGGAVALTAAAQRLEAVHSLTLIEPGAFDVAAQDPAVRQMLAQQAQVLAIADPRQRLEAFAALVGIHKTWSDPLPESARRLAENLTSIRPSSVSSRHKAEQVAAAGIPSLLISGGDRAPIEKVCDVLAEIMSAQRVVIAGYGHAPHYSGEPFNTCVEQFWSRLPS